MSFDVGITDDLSADDVWDIITDILQSVLLADGETHEVYDVVNDYVGNRYGEGRTSE